MWIALLAGAFMGAALFVLRLRQAGALPAQLITPTASVPASGPTFMPASKPTAAPAAMPTPTRPMILATARSIAGQRWVCRPPNTMNRCLSAYRSDWKANQLVTGIAYKWGGMDGPAEFQSKLRRGYAAGAHSYHGVNSCSAGMDCSGFVTYCWGFRDHTYSTRTMHHLAAHTALDPYRDLRPGDALVKPGSHAVLFAGYRHDGNPNVYEAAGTSGRVILNRTSTWRRYQGYQPLRYRWVVE